jgi:hypothetical protein
MQEEDEFVRIIKESKKRLITLKIVSNFFKQQDLIGILIRTKIIHSIFENNNTLDSNKLELFHIQYTDSLIELLQKLKKAKEQQFIITSDEIHINDDYIKKLEVGLNDAFFQEKTVLHSKNMSGKVEQLFEMLTTESTKAFNWDSIVYFSNCFKAEYYRIISKEQYEKLTILEKDTYSHTNAKFERKLLGRLNKFKFKFKFLCGLIYNNEVIEVYEFRDTNDKFIFNNKDKSFFFLDETFEKTIDLSKNNSNNNKIINQLKIKNSSLKHQLDKIKTSLPDNVLEILKNYLDKISGIDFMEELQNIDEQANILKAMLNININSK